MILKVQYKGKQQGTEKIKCHEEIVNNQYL